MKNWLPVIAAVLGAFGAIHLARDLPRGCEPHGGSVVKLFAPTLLCPEVRG